MFLMASSLDSASDTPSPGRSPPGFVTGELFFRARLVRTRHRAFFLTFVAFISACRSIFHGGAFPPFALFERKRSPHLIFFDFYQLLPSKDLRRALDSGVSESFLPPIIFQLHRRFLRTAFQDPCKGRGKVFLLKGFYSAFH